jgi:hypothetical protein
MGSGSVSAGHVYSEIKNITVKLEFKRLDAMTQKKIEAENALERDCFGVRNSINNKWLTDG